MITIHNFESTSDAYAAVNTDDDVHDGDVLVVESEHVVGVAVQAWPTAVTVEHGAFHTLNDAARWDALGAADEVVHDGKLVVAARPAIDYSASRDVALAIADTLWGPLDEGETDRSERVVPTSSPSTTHGRELAEAFPCGARVAFSIEPDPWLPEGVSGEGTIAGVVESVADQGDPESGPYLVTYHALAIWHEGKTYHLHPEDGDSTLRALA